jgi:hypothetical protein
MIAGLAGIALLQTRSAPAKPLRLRSLRGDQITALPLSSTGAKATVFLFIAHDCPISNAYAPEIGRIEARFMHTGIRFDEVYAEPDLPIDEARAHHANFKLRGQGLLDPQRQLAHRLKATITPEAVVVLADGSVAYRGRIDNTYASIGVRRNVTTSHELIDALDAALAGKHPKVSAAPALGCAIP